MTVKLGLIKLLTKRFDLCEELSVFGSHTALAPGKLPELTFGLCDCSANINSSLACPIDPGVYSFTHTVALPNEIPRGTYRTRTRLQLAGTSGHTADQQKLMHPGFYGLTAKFQVNARVVTPVVEEEVGCLDLWSTYAAFSVHPDSDH